MVILCLVTGACIMKLFIAVINSAAKKASVFVTASQMWLTIPKGLVYYAMEFITAVKSFIIQATGLTRLGLEDMILKTRYQ